MCFRGNYRCRGSIYESIEAAPMIHTELQQAKTHTLQEIIRIKQQIAATVDSKEKRRLIRRKRELQFLQMWQMNQLKNI